MPLHPNPPFGEATMPCIPVRLWLTERRVKEPGFLSTTKAFAEGIQLQRSSMSSARSIEISTGATRVSMWRSSSRAAPTVSAADPKRLTIPARSSRGTNAPMAGVFPLRIGGSRNCAHDDRPRRREMPPVRAAAHGRERIHCEGSQLPPLTSSTTYLPFSRHELPCVISPPRACTNQVTGPAFAGR